MSTTTTTTTTIGRCWSRRRNLQAGIRRMLLGSTLVDGSLPSVVAAAAVRASITRASTLFTRQVKQSSSAGQSASSLQARLFKLALCSSQFHSLRSMSPLAAASPADRPCMRVVCISFGIAAPSPSLSPESSACSPLRMTTARSSTPLCRARCHPSIQPGVSQLRDAGIDRSSRVEGVECIPSGTDRLTACVRASEPA